MSESPGSRVCAKCEMPLGLEMKFCRNCGAPVHGSRSELLNVRTTEPEGATGGDQVLAQGSGSGESSSKHRISPEKGTPLPKTSPVLQNRKVSNGQQSSYTSNITAPPDTERVLPADSYGTVRRTKRRRLARYLIFTSLLSALFLAVLLAGLLTYSYVSKKTGPSAEPGSTSAPLPAPVPAPVTGNAAELLAAAKADLQAGKPNDAIEKLDRAIQIDNTNAEQYKVRGDALAGSSRFTEAIESYRQAIARNAGYFEAHSSLARSYEQMGQDDEAIASYTSALIIKGDDAELRLKFARALQRRGRLDEARKNFEQVLASPDTQLAAAAKQELARLNTPRNAATQPKPVNGTPTVTEPSATPAQPVPNNDPVPEPPKPKPEPPRPAPSRPSEPVVTAEQHKNQGIKLASQGDTAGALREYQSVLKLEPNNQDVYYLMGQVYEKIGDFEAALQSYERCQTSSHYASIARNHVKMLKKKLKK
jgi:tetratricopeptide (TPR) repeat protein